MERQQEIERKFTMSPGAALPLLPPGSEYGDTDDFDLTATYFDTPDLVLARNRRVLRRRTGGDDAGWHLKLPFEGARTEIRLGLKASRSPLVVPAELRAEVSDLVATRPLIPVAELHTRRLQTQVHPRGSTTVVALVADDTVTSRRLPGGEPFTWRELEVELVTGDVALLESVTESWLSQGVAQSSSVSKLAQTLGDAVEKADQRIVGAQTPAANVVMDYVAAQVGMLQARHADLTTDEPDAVHKSRVATRRLRSALTTWRPLLDEEALGDLVSEIKWVSAELGAPRDAEVLRDTLVEQAQALPGVDPGTVESLRTALEVAHRQTLQELLTAMQTARYTAVHERLVELLLHPPTRADGGSAGTALPPILQRAEQSVLRHHQAAAALQGDERLHELHETRKKAKRARYAAEAAAPALGRSAGEQAAQWESVTEALGHLQDSVVATESLRRLRNVDPELTRTLLIRQDTVRDDALKELDLVLPDGRSVPGSR